MHWNYFFEILVCFVLLAIEQKQRQLSIYIFCSWKFNVRKLSYNTRNVLSVKSEWFKMNLKFVTCFCTICLVIFTYLYLGASLRRSCPTYVFQNLIKKNNWGLMFCICYAIIKHFQYIMFTNYRSVLIYTKKLITWLFNYIKFFDNTFILICLNIISETYPVKRIQTEMIEFTLILASKLFRTHVFC